MPRNGYLFMPRTVYEDLKGSNISLYYDVPILKDDIVSIRVEDDSNDDFRDIFREIYQAYPDAPFDIRQEQAEGGYDFSSGVDTFIRPGQPTIDIYWDDDWRKTINISDLENIHNIETLHALIETRKAQEPVPIEEASRIYNQQITEASAQDRNPSVISSNGLNTTDIEGLIQNPEFIGVIADSIEDFLGKHNATLDGQKNDVILTGNNYDELMGSIKNCLLVSVKELAEEKNVPSKSDDTFSKAITRVSSQMEAHGVPLATIGRELKDACDAHRLDLGTRLSMQK